MPQEKTGQEMKDVQIVYLAESLNSPNKMRVILPGYPPDRQAIDRDDWHTIGIGSMMAMVAGAIILMIGYFIFGYFLGTVSVYATAVKPDPSSPAR